MKFIPLSDNAARQAIDASNIWVEYQRAKAAAKPYVGGMYWKREGAYEYLVKTAHYLELAHLCVVECVANDKDVEAFSTCISDITESRPQFKPRNFSHLHWGLVGQTGFWGHRGAV